MTASLPPSLSLGVDVKESGSGKRLSLAIARLDVLIARLNHLPELANQPFSHSEKDKTLPHQILVGSVTSNQEDSINSPSPD